MRGCRANGLVLIACLAVGVQQAHAQVGAPSVWALPPTGASPSQPAARMVGYFDQAPPPVPPAPIESFGSSFGARAQAPGEAAPGTLAMPSPTVESVWDDSIPCNTCGSLCNSCCGCRWFASLGVIAMGRNRPNPYWTTFQTNNNVNQLMNTQHAGANWAPGGQVSVGYNFCPCGPALAFTYWGLAPMEGFSHLRDVNDQLSTPINLTTQTGNVMIGGRPASDFFDNSREHRIARDDRVNNFELNLLQGNMVNGGRLQMTAFVGFRYFRFDEGLSFGATAAGVEFNTPGGNDEAYLNFRCTNNLFGGQLGAIFNYAATNRLGIFATPKAGIYGNQMITNVHLFAANGDQGFNISGYKSDVSFLGELDFGFNYAITQNVRAFLGYRVIGVSGVALADNQFLPFLADSAGFAQVKQNGDLILHGMFTGLSWTF